MIANVPDGPNPGAIQHKNGHVVYLVRGDHYRCTACRCNVTRHHIPKSRECLDLRDLRIESQTDTP